MSDSKGQHGGACFSRSCGNKPREKKPTRSVGAAAGAATASVLLSKVPDSKWEAEVLQLSGDYPGEPLFNIYKALEHYNGDILLAKALLDLPLTKRGGKITRDIAETKCSLIERGYIPLIDAVISECERPPLTEEDAWCYAVKWYGDELKYCFLNGRHRKDYEINREGYKSKLGRPTLINKLETHYGTRIAESLAKHAEINKIREVAEKEAQGNIARATKRDERLRVAAVPKLTDSGRNVRDGGGKRPRRKSKIKKRHRKTRKRKSKRRKYTKKR